jgi:hypothetical protein
MSFAIAMTMPISTNTTIADCIQIQVGDMFAWQHMPARLKSQSAR